MGNDKLSGYFESPEMKEMLNHVRREITEKEEKKKNVFYENMREKWKNKTRA